MRRTVRRTQMPTGGMRETDVSEHYLTEAQCPYLATKGETTNAVALTKEMIRDFMLARRGPLQERARRQCFDSTRMMRVESPAGPRPTLCLDVEMIPSFVEVGNLRANEGRAHALRPHARDVAQKICVTAHGFRRARR